MFALCDYDYDKATKPGLNAELDPSFYAGQSPPALCLLLNEGGGNPHDIASGNVCALTGGETWGSGFLKGNGTSAYVNVAAIKNIPVGSAPRTIQAKIRLNAIASGNNSAIVSIGTTEAGQEFVFQIALISGSVYVFTDGINAGNNITISGSQIPSLGVWHDIAFAFDGSLGWKYYLDGQLAKSGSFAVAINTNATTMTIGGRQSGVNTGYLDGDIETLRISSAFDSPSQIALLAANPYADVQQSVMGRFFGAGASGFQPAWASGANVLIGGGLAA